MKVEILGTRANIRLEHPQHKKYTGILIDGKILVDVGEAEYLHRNPEFIFLTHLHSDHANFTDEIFSNRSRPKIIYAPEEHRSIQGIVIPLVINFFP